MHRSSPHVYKAGFDSFPAPMRSDQRGQCDTPYDQSFLYPLSGVDFIVKFHQDSNLPSSASTITADCFCPMRSQVVAAIYSIPPNGPRVQPQITGNSNSSAFSAKKDANTSDFSERSAANYPDLKPLHHIQCLPVHLWVSARGAHRIHNDFRLWKGSFDQYCI